MKELFLALRNIFTFAILIILLKSFGYADWRTWVIFILVYAAMFCDYMFEICKQCKNL